MWLPIVMSRNSNISPHGLQGPIFLLQGPGLSVSASSVNLIEIWNLKPTPDLLNQTLHGYEIPKWFVNSFKIEKHSPQPRWYHSPNTVAFLLLPTCFSGSYFRAFALAISFAWLLGPHIGVALFCHLDFSSSSIPSESLRVLTPRELHYPAIFSHSVHSLKLYGTYLCVCMFITWLLSLEY